MDYSIDKRAITKYFNSKSISGSFQDPFTSHTYSNVTNHAILFVFHIANRFL